MVCILVSLPPGTQIRYELGAGSPVNPYLHPLEARIEMSLNSPSSFLSVTLLYRIPKRENLNRYMGSRTATLEVVDEGPEEDPEIPICELIAQKEEGRGRKGLLDFLGQ
jgi:hypothetical protein